MQGYIAIEAYHVRSLVLYGLDFPYYKVSAGHKSRSCLISECNLQVLANMLANAVKFTERGEVVLDARVEASPSGDAGPDPDPGTGGDADCRRPTHYVHVAMRDTGIGISAASMAKLFQCFRQGHESMSRKYGGTGTPILLGPPLISASMTWSERPRL